jgi:hypothetical protein
MRGELQSGTLPSNANSPFQKEGGEEKNEKRRPKRRRRRRWIGVREEKKATMNGNYFT